VRPFIDWLYKITSQRAIPPAKPLELLTAHHFKACWKIAKLQGAQARLLVAEKENGPLPADE
jgi:hypothetical protein